jgi:hypothetical protein
MREFFSGMIVALVFSVVLMAAGCKKAENQSLDAFLKQSGPNRPTVYALAGRVTIVGQPPQFDRPLRLVVMLNDPQNPILAQRPSRQCNDEGEFAFGTYTKDDGIPPGTFTITFAVLKVTPQGLVGPDRLKNLYNDPDKNALVPEFKIVHEAPGKKDYVFDLKVASQEAIATPGPNALTELRLQSK